MATPKASASISAPPKKDAGKEFRQINDGSYFDADSALRDADSFISTFNSDSDAWKLVEDMKDIRKELKSMSQFFNGYYSPSQFKEAANGVASEYRNSEWKVVRMVWSRAYDSTYDELVRDALDDIDADAFRSYMIKDAEDRCLENYESNGPLGIGYMLSRDHYTEVISIDTPDQIDGKKREKDHWHIPRSHGRFPGNGTSGRYRQNPYQGRVGNHNGRHSSVPPRGLRHHRADRLAAIGSTEQN